MRAILAGGGTGGHVIPALAIAQELQKRYSAEVLFIGTARGIENRLVPAAGFPLRLVQVGALNKVSLKTRLKTLFDLPRAVWDARRMLAEFRPDIVIGVGGYASGPAMLAAILKGIPTLAFEPNVVPGFANRMVARWVSGAAVHFEETAQIFPQCRSHRRAGARGVFSRSPGKPPRSAKPTLLVFGGSQGANAINQAMIQCLPELVRQVPDIHIIHQTGERDYNDAQAAYQQAGLSAEVVPVHHGHAGFLCARRFDAVPFGREHGGGNYGGREAGGFCSVSRARRTIISGSTPRRWSEPARQSWWKKPSWSECGWRIPSPRCWVIPDGCNA